MITKIKTDPCLEAFICSNCEENGISVDVCDKIIENEIAFIKVDDYYASLNLRVTPPSVDFLVPVDCYQNNYVLYLIELKNISSPKGFTVSNVYAKFKTTLEDFMAEKFASIFLNGGFKIKDILLYFVSDPYGLIKKGINYDDYKQVKKNSLKTETLLLQKPFKFDARIIMIRYKLPGKLVIQKL